MHSLSKDLATIRKKSELTIQEIQEKTRISVPILQSIEDGSIFSQLEENNTYVRNYVRSYARAIGVSEQKIILALNQTQQNKYDGFLIAPDDQSAANENHAEETSSTNDESAREAVEEESTDQKEHAQPVKKEPITEEERIASTDWNWVKIGENPTTKTRQSSVKKNSYILFAIALIIVAIFLIYYLN